MIRVYLDNCCFNRPFDNQSSIRVKMETDAKLYIQFMILTGKIELVWSYIIDFENEANPFVERRDTIEKWKRLAVVVVIENNPVLTKAEKYTNEGLKAKDALHIACAIESGCQYFITTDDVVLKKMVNKTNIVVLNPIDFLKIEE
ncbi:MAG: PIN domain-containing protein [Ginsengibacter sp.]